MTAHVGILISGGGSNMEALVRSMTGDHPGRPAVVLCNEPEAGGIRRAADLGVGSHMIDHRRFLNRDYFEEALTFRLENYSVDVVCLAGFMRILSPGFVSHWAGRVLNIHPSLLPRYKGLNTHARALEAGDDVHGCTVHEVTADLDDGPILGQAQLQIEPDDTPESLAARLLPLEHRLYPAVLRRFLDGDRSPLML